MSVTQPGFGPVINKTGTFVIDNYITMAFDVVHQTSALFSISCGTKYGIFESIIL